MHDRLLDLGPCQPFGQEVGRHLLVGQVAQRHVAVRDALLEQVADLALTRADEFRAVAAAEVRSLRSGRLWGSECEYREAAFGEVKLLHLLVNAVECGVLADIAPKNDVQPSFRSSF
mgnify:CR=1 FL=1